MARFFLHSHALSFELNFFSTGGSLYVKILQRHYVLIKVVVRASYGAYSKTPPKKNLVVKKLVCRWFLNRGCK